MEEIDKTDRIRGAILGLACGDALGAPAEFLSREALAAKFGRLTEMVGNYLWEPGEWTDDTAMALCVAEGILAAPEDPVAEIGRRFRAWLASGPKDVGNTISQALGGYNGSWPDAARGTEAAKTGKAAGSGSLMRTLPVALAYPDEAEMLRQSARISAMTHWDPQAEVCCAVYCLWVRGLLAGEDRLPAWENALISAREWAGRSNLAEGQTPGPGPLPAGFWERLAAVPGLPESALQPSGYAGYAVECLEAAVWWVLRASSPEEALVGCVNLAGEADTIAAVAGGAAGAHWGASALPERWRERLRDRDRLAAVAGNLALLRRHREVYARPGLPPFSYRPIGSAGRLWHGRNPLTAWDVETLLGHGVTHVLDLREPREWNPAANRYGAEALDALAARGVVRQHVPVPDGSPPDPSAFEEAVRFLEKAFDSPEARVYVHCRMGLERTGTVLVAYRALRDGLSYEDALEALREEGAVIDPLPGQEVAARKWIELQHLLRTAA